MNASVNAIVDSPQRIQLTDGILEGGNLVSTVKKIGDLTDFFVSEAVRKKMDQQKIVYTVQAHLPVPEGTPGGLFFGTTRIRPGLVGDEYFMTKGHFHSLADRSEYYWGLHGEGVLILMDTKRRFWGERIYAGSLHYIPAHTAHRVANTGDQELAFGACWPADAGHNYDEITQNGFSCRLLKIAGKPQLIGQESLKKTLL
jgi:glucose-6-phosphate isomerase